MDDPDPAEEQLAPGLWWSESDRTATVAADEPDGGRRPLLRFIAQPTRLTFELAVFADRPGIDISFQPSAAVLALTDAARERASDPNRWERVTAIRLRTAAEIWGLPSPQPDGLLAVLGSLSHPALRPLLLAGARPLAEIPRWARAVLEATTLAQGLRRQFGSDATRALIRALGAAISAPTADPVSVGDAPPDLAPLGLALCGQGLLSADQLALVASATGPRRAPEQWPTVDDLSLAHRTLPRLGAERATSLLVEAAGRDDHRAVFEVLELVEISRSLLSGALPGRIDALRERCAAVAPRIQPPAAVVEAPVPQAARAAGGYRYNPPLADVDGAWVDEYQLRLPHNRRELVEWSRSLDNCLDTYPPRVANNRSWIVGVEHHNRLVAAIEIAPATQRIVQFLGPANRPVSDRMRRLVEAALVERAVVRPDNRT